MCTDYLRCTPKFFGKPRYDCVLVQTVHKCIFARILFIFAIKLGSSYHAIVLIQPYDSYLGPRRRKDEELGLFRVGAKPNSEFIPLRSIIRGALLVQDFDEEKSGEFIVVDVIDGDMFFRIKEMSGKFQSCLVGEVFVVN